MLQRYQRIYSGETVSRPTVSLLMFRAPSDGTINRVDIWGSVSIGTAIFNLTINGIAQWAGAARPEIAGGGTHAEKTGLAIAVSQGDLIALDVVDHGTSGVGSPSIYFQVEIDDAQGVPVGGAAGEFLVKDSSADHDTSWAPVPVALEYAASDETTDLATGTAKLTFRMPYRFVLTEVRASVNTAPTGADIVVDINEGGVSILSTKLRIDASEKTSTTSAIPAVISDADLADDAEMTIDFDQVGSTVAGKGLKVTLIGRRYY